MAGRLETRARHPRRRGNLVALIMSLCMLTAALPGCESSASGGGNSTGSAQIPSVAMGAKEMAFSVPDHMPASGLLSITFTNQGKQPHQANIARLNDGVTPDQVTAVLKTNPDQVVSMVTFVGGPNSVDPGKSQAVVVDMPPGTYVAICYEQDVNDPSKSHVTEGMYAYFTVPSTSGVKPAEPQDNGVVILRDFGIDLPGDSPFSSGPVTWKVWNHGGQPHELTLLKLAAGKTENDALAYLQQQNPAGPPPFSDAGGMAALGLDKSGWVTLSLDAGSYIALCFVTDPASGKPHFMLGMSRSFTVA